jgi:adenylate cyclase
MSDSMHLKLEAPYPLSSKFRHIVLPGLVILIAVIAVTFGKGSRFLVEEIYLILSQARAVTIDRALTDKDPTDWSNLQRSLDPISFFKSSQGQKLKEVLRGEIKELKLSHLKIYGNEGLLLYSSDEFQIGSSDRSKGYLDARKGNSNLVLKQMDDGSKLYELYVKTPDNPNQIVMELYEPVDYLDSLSMEIIVPAILFPVGVLIFIGLVMRHLVNHAQLDINARTDLIREFRSKLQKLLSQEAVSSVRSSIGSGDVVSRRIRVTILFSDIRGFTSLCEVEPPETVVSFLNTSLGIVINAVAQNQGDVDKMIGDAVLAYFQGKDAEKRALQAAHEAMQSMKNTTLSRAIGIGIYTGDVVVGTIGAANRMDFTIVGDSVNVASRLCSAAQENDIVIDQQSYISATGNQADEFESLRVKGKQQPLLVKRIG